MGEFSSLDQNVAKIQRYAKGKAADYSESFEGKLVNKQGLVVDDNGVAFGILADAGGPWYAGCHCDKDGNVYQKVGQVERILDAVSGIKTVRTFKEGEGLRMVRDGKVVNENGIHVGQLAGGNHKRVIGMVVDTDGTVRDLLGNAREYADPIESWIPEDCGLLINPEADDTINGIPRRPRLNKLRVPNTKLDFAMPVNSEKRQTDHSQQCYDYCERSPATHPAPVISTDYVPHETCNSPSTPPDPGTYADLVQDDLLQKPLQAPRTSLVTYANSGVDWEQRMRFDVDQAKPNSDVNELLRMWTLVEA